MPLLSVASCSLHAVVVSETRTPRTRHPIRLRTLLLWCAAALLLLAIAYAWMGFRVGAALGHLQSARDDAERAVAAASAGDRDSLADGARALSDELTAAQEASDDPTWAVAMLAPVIGRDLDAVRTLAQALGPAAATSEPLVGALRSGTVDVAGATKSLGALAERVARAHDALAEVDTAPLLSPVADAVERTRTLLNEAQPTLSAAAALAPLGDVVGGAGPTRILVMLQNNAELRTGGGITGAYLQITAADGTYSLDAQSSSGDFTPRMTPIVDTPAALTTLYGDVVGRFAQNASMPADFATTARLASAWWQERGGAAPDLVVSVDPVILVAALRITGPIALADGSMLTADDAITRLLVEPYYTLDADGQTALMQDAAARVFAHLTATPPDPFAWAAALAEPVMAGRISAWSADPTTEAALSSGPLGGPGARLEAAGPDGYGLWLNDGTGGKMGGFLDLAVAIETSQCRADGRADVLVRLTMTSTAPQDAGSVLPGDVTGRGMYGTGIGDIGTSVAIAAPAGTFLSSVTKEGSPARVAQAVEDGRPTTLLRVNLSPGEVNVVDFRFVTAQPEHAMPVLVHTPMLSEPRIAETTTLACG